MLPGENVVAVGERLDRRLAELQTVTPTGMQLTAIYDQPKIVDESVSGFIINVVAALVIVIIVLLFFMGLRTGLIIGAVLLITVSGTLWFMNFYAIDLQRISLGALIIALGMLVDNAIVVVDGMKVRMEQGMDGMKAAKEGEPAWESPWGNGRPGWHIECSAMCYQLLGETFDIHGGGKDLIFPHHENEIAIAGAVTGKPLARYWMHSELLLVDGKKMSSENNNNSNEKENIGTTLPEENDNLS